MLRTVTVVGALAIAAPAVADPVSGGVEVGATVAGEGSGGGGEQAGAVRVAGEVGASSDRGHAVATGVIGHLGSGMFGPLRGRHWLSARYELGAELRERNGPRDYLSWVSLAHAYDYQARATLDRRRDLVRGRYTGGHLQMDSALIGGGDEDEGGALGVFTWDLDYIDAVDDGGIDVMHRMRITTLRFWDGPFTREILVIDSYLADYQRQAVADTVIAYAERDRPLVGALRGDWRIGFATNTGTTEVNGQTFVNQRHPDVTAGVLDGALRLPLGAATLEARYDRSLYLTLDALLGLEDRLTARAAWRRGRWTLGADLFAAHTWLWRDRGVAGEHSTTDGIAGRASVQVHGFVADAAVEAGHSFYAAPDVAAMTPAAGWRVTLDVSRRFGASRTTAPLVR